VDHPRYKGRRVFDAGINLTKIYHGKVSYMFYLDRDAALYSKIYRGLTSDPWDLEFPEETLEKPWLAAVDSFAIGGGCQLLLVVDYVVAESGAYFSLPARKEGIIPGAANMRLPRFLGERAARQGIMFDKTFYVDSPETSDLVNEVVSRDQMDATIQHAVDNALGSGMVSASGNRKALRVQSEPLDDYRRYMAVYCEEQAYCHLSEQLISNLEKHWNAASRSLAAT
jgi:thioesterase DpgC